MEIKIESIICNWADEILHILIRVINAVALSANEGELRTSIRHIAEETALDKFFRLRLRRTSLLAHPSQAVQW